MKLLSSLVLGLVVAGSNAVANDLEQCPTNVLRAKTSVGHKWFINTSTKKFEITTTDGTTVNGRVLAFSCSVDGAFSFEVIRNDNIRHVCSGSFAGREVPEANCGSESITGTFE